MSSRTARRVVLPGLTAIELVMGTPTVVWAHSPLTHTSSAAVARPDRAELRVREATLGPDGRTRYTESRYVATAHGAEIQRTHSVAGPAGGGTAPGTPEDAAPKKRTGAPAADGASGTAGRPAPAASSSGPDGPRHQGRPPASAAPRRTAHDPRRAQWPRARSHRFGEMPREPRMPAALREPGMPREPRMPSMPREFADSPGPSF